MSTDRQRAEDEFQRPFTIGDEDRRSADEQVRKQALMALSLWAGCLESYNAMVQAWTDARRQGVSRLMNALAHAGEEPDINKRAGLVAGAYMDQFQTFFKDLASANMQALAVGNAYTRKIMRQAVSEARAATGSDLFGSPPVDAGQGRNADPAPPPEADTSSRRRRSRT